MMDNLKLHMPLLRLAPLKLGHQELVSRLLYRKWGETWHWLPISRDRKARRNYFPFDDDSGGTA
jgi:hypothetical protein